MPINFYNDDYPYQIKNKKILKSWIRETIKNFDYKIDVINFIFCSSDKILEINNKFLNHNFHTDIITFPYSESRIIAADIFICIPVVEENANDYKVSFLKELHRVIIHGTLHLVGFCDSTKEEISIMRAKEDFFLDKLNTLLNIW